MDALLLSRIQFGFVISYHILFPAFTIGLASWLMFLEFRWLRTRDNVWLDLYKFWSKVFAISFGMGVVSGIVMSFQFGTNWSRLSERAGAVLGPLLSYEVLTAFFLEAGFLGVMLFGANKVRPLVHFFCTCMVALGTLISTFWILASNSWMHTPQGFTIENGQVIPQDWLAIVFNPSFPYRLIHMAIAAFLSSALFVGASAAWHLLRGNDTPAVRTMFSMAMWMALVVAPVQAFIGDAHGLNTLEYQPVKIAAIEGHWENKPGEPTPLILFGIPNMKTETTDYKIEVPYLGSLILTHSLDKQIPAMKDYPAADRPNSTIVFFTFRIMVALGMLMIFIGLWSVWLRKRGTLYENRWFLRLVLWMGPSGLIAILAGWFTTEIGRQPWVVYGLMRTADASSNHSVTQMSITLVMFVVVYFSLFGVGLGYMMRLVRKGPITHEGDDETHGGPGQQRTPARPLSAAHEGTDEGHSDSLTKGN